jgi:hypothetical protein
MPTGWRRARRAGRWGLEERAGPDATARTRRLAELLAPATLSDRYPGLGADGCVRDARHYLDRHLTVPSLSSASASAQSLPGSSATESHRRAG